MKKFLIVLALAFGGLISTSTAQYLNRGTPSPFATNCDFDAGWRAGYADGYCYRQANCMRPYVPMVPARRMGECSYEDGYNRGFLAGLNAR